MEILIALKEFTGSRILASILGSIILNISIYLIFKIVKNIYNFIFDESPQRGIDRINVSKVQFVREVVKWCVENLGLAKKTNHPPNVQLVYYKHSGKYGHYFSINKQITVYWGSHSSIMEIIDTTIHEYQHYLDLRNSNDAKAYDKESEKVGYYKNIYEVRARKIAEKHRGACFQALKKKNIIL